MEGEGKDISAAQLRYIHERKTSALLWCCSARLGGMSANCTARQLKALTDFGYNVGLAFQIIDDILDVTQTSEQLGKTAWQVIIEQPAERGDLLPKSFAGDGKIAENRERIDRPGIPRP